MNVPLVKLLVLYVRRYVERINDRVTAELRISYGHFPKNLQDVEGVKDTMGKGCFRLFSAASSITKT